MESFSQTICFLLRSFGTLLVVVCLVALVILLATWFKSSPEGYASVYDSIQNIRTTALVWLGKGCLMLVAADVLDGKFTWRKR